MLPSREELIQTVVKSFAAHTHYALLNGATGKYPVDIKKLLQYEAKHQAVIVMIDKQIEVRRMLDDKLRDVFQDTPFYQALKKGLAEVYVSADSEEIYDLYINTLVDLVFHDMIREFTLAQQVLSSSDHFAIGAGLSQKTHEQLRIMAEEGGGTLPH